METTEKRINMKRVTTWGIFILIIGLITWGMIAAGKKAERESANVATVDKVVSTDNIRGATSSPVTIIEYSDFECPACGAYFPLVERVFEEASTTLLFVYRHFPLSQHPYAIPAARAAEAAGKQGKFWEMYSMIFSNQEIWSKSETAETIFADYAKKLGLNTEKYAIDVASQEVADKVDNDQKSGFKAEVNSTPTFYVNGKKINSPKSYEEFRKIIEEAAQPATNS